jgi:hypothetical protein
MSRGGAAHLHSAHRSQYTLRRDPLPACNPARGCSISWSSVTQRHTGAPRRPAMEFAATVMLAAVVLYLLTQVEDLHA